MMDELRFAVRCHGSTKKPKPGRHCSQCGGLDGGAVPGGEPSPNGVLLAQSTVPRPSVSVAADDRLHYRRSARLDCDYAVDNRRRTSMRCVDPDGFADRRPSAVSDLRHDAAVVKTPDKYRDTTGTDGLARSFAKV